MFAVAKYWARCWADGLVLGKWQVQNSKNSARNGTYPVPRKHRSGTYTQGVPSIRCDKSWELHLKGSFDFPIFKKIFKAVLKEYRYFIILKYNPFKYR